MNIGLIGVGGYSRLAARVPRIERSAGMSAIGPGRRRSRRTDGAFLLFAFVGAPLTQTIYGYIVRNSLSCEGGRTTIPHDPRSACPRPRARRLGWFQGKAPHRCDAFTKPARGFANYRFVSHVETTARS